MKNIIFLDIDGVLNDNITTFKSNNIQTLKELTQQYNAKIVMITSWQLNGTENRRKRIKQLFKKLGIYNIEFIDPNFEGNIFFKDSISPIEIDCRLLGIIDYLKKEKDCNYVILDDEYHNDYKMICLNHYRTNPNKGLTNKDLNKIKFKRVNLDNFKYINYKYRKLGGYELVENKLVKVLKKAYKKKVQKC